MKLDFSRNVKRNMVANAVSSGIRLAFSQLPSGRETVVSTQSPLLLTTINVLLAG